MRWRLSRVFLVSLALGSTLWAQLMFDAQRRFSLAATVYAGGLLLLAATIRRPLRALVPDGRNDEDPLSDGAEPASRLSVRTEALACFALLAVGAFFRFYELDAIPPGFNHDSALLSQYAIEFLYGEAPLAPFFSPPLHYPIGYETFQPLVTAFFISRLGIVPLASKLSAATSSLASLVVLYFFVRYVFGQRMAIITSFLAAVCGWHFIFGRVGWHCVAVPLWETIAVFLLIASLRSRRPALFAAAGAATAVNLTTYSISRILLPKQALLIAYLCLRKRIRVRAHGGGLLVFLSAFFLFSLPVAIWAARHWEVFQGRTRALLVLGRGFRQALAPLLENLRSTILNLNYRANGDDFFIDRPLLDLPTSWLFAVGLVLCLVLFDRPRYGILLLWFSSSMLPGLLSSPNPNHNMAALFPAMVLAGLAADQLLSSVRRAVGRPGRWLAPSIACLAGVLVVGANVRWYISSGTRRDLWGFYPETRRVGEYMSGILDRYDVYVADNFPIDTLMFLTYRGGEYVPRFHHLWENGRSILTIPLSPPKGKGVALLAKPRPENDSLFRDLLAQHPGARRLDLPIAVASDRQASTAATVVLIDPPSLPRVARAPSMLVHGTPDSRATAFSGGTGSGPAQFDEVMGIAAGPDGSFYAADLRNNRIQKFDEGGRFVWATGRPGSGPGEFNEPRGVAVDDRGGVFVVDSWNARVQRFDAEGRFVLAMTSAKGMLGPKGVAVRGDRVFVSDTGNGTVEVFDVNGAHLGTWGSPGTSEGQFRDPVGIACDAQGSVYVADTGNGRIQKLSRAGRFVSAWPVGEWADGAMKEGFLASDEAGRLLLADPEKGLVIAFDHEGRRVWTREGFRSPTGLAPRREDLLVSERAANRVLSFRHAGP